MKPSEYGCTVLYLLQCSVSNKPTSNNTIVLQIGYQTLYLSLLPLPRLKSIQDLFCVTWECKVVKTPEVSSPKNVGKGVACPNEVWRQHFRCNTGSQLCFSSSVTYQTWTTGANRWKVFKFDQKAPWPSLSCSKVTWMSRQDSNNVCIPVQD